MKMRQVHLDFHTSEHISGIGSAFDKAQFQNALKVGFVQSVTLFSKCHHGWSYHPTKTNEMHPHLSFDLLRAQLDAAHEIGVQAPVYLSAGFDEKYVREHPEDRVCGTLEIAKAGGTNLNTAGYHILCFNTPYLDTLAAQVKEVCENYDADWIFLDISKPRACYCRRCQEQMKAQGYDIQNPDDVARFGHVVYDNYARRIREAIDSVKPGLPVFHNGGHIPFGKKSVTLSNSHLELESLPTGGWGYDHFPMSVSYAQSLGMDRLGMTGKFHLNWGEFGGFKHPNALLYETALSLANGAGCSIGDQLHPSGAMDMATYQLIGTDYKDVASKESYIKDSRNLADIAVLGTEAIGNYYGRSAKQANPFTAATDAGCSRILLEGHYLFHFIDVDTPLDGYRLLILADGITLDAALIQKIKAFTKNGGKVLASGRSGLNDEGQFALQFGGQWLGANEYSPDYCVPKFTLPSLAPASYIMYAQGFCVSADEDTAVLANRENPYFNRTPEHFCSHQHAPNDPSYQEPAIIEGPDGIYIGWDIFDQYATHGSIHTKEIVCHLIDRLLPQPLLSSNLPAQGISTLMDTPSGLLVHLLYGAPVRRGQNVEIIEDLLPVLDTEVRVSCAAPIKCVKLVPQEIEIPFRQENGIVSFCVEKFQCHQMVLLQK